MTDTEVIFSSNSHKKLVTGFIENVYEYADLVKCSELQLLQFSMVVNDIVQSSNNFYNSINLNIEKGNERDMYMSEWVYKIPTSLLYASLGFFGGLKTEANNDAINNVIEATISSFNSIYEELQFVADVNELLDNISLN